MPPRDEVSTFEFDPSESLISRELEENFRRLVTECVQTDPGITLPSIITNMIEGIGESGLDVNVTKAKTIVLEILNTLTNEGQLTRVECKIANTLLVSYFPARTLFTITPPNLANVEKPPTALLRILDPPDMRCVNSIVDYLKWVRSHQPDVVLRVVNAFCPRCGDDSDGHICGY